MLPIFIGCLSLFSGFFLFLATKAVLPIAIHHVIYYCSTVISPIAVAIPSQVSLGFLLFLLSLTGISFFRVAQLFLSTFIMLHRVKKQSVSPVLIKKLLHTYHLEEHTSLLVNDRPFAFTFGFFQPKIYISTGLLSMLNYHEIEAVLVHEAYHRSHHHSFGRLLQNTAKIFLPILPLVGELIQNQIISEEIKADQAALSEVKDTTILFSSFKKLLLCSNDFALVPSFTSYDTLEARINALQNKKNKITVSWKNIMVSIFSMAILFSIVSTPVRASTSGINSCSNHVCASACNNENSVSYSRQNISLPASFLYTTAN